MTHDRYNYYHHYPAEEQLLLRGHGAGSLRKKSDFSSWDMDPFKGKFWPQTATIFRGWNPTYPEKWWFCFFLLAVNRIHSSDLLIYRKYRKSSTMLWEFEHLRAGIWANLWDLTRTSWGIVAYPFRKALLDLTRLNLQVDVVKKSMMWTMEDQSSSVFPAAVGQLGGMLIQRRHHGKPLARRRSLEVNGP